MKRVASTLVVLTLEANEVAEMVQNHFAQVQVVRQQTRNATLAPAATQELDTLVKEFDQAGRQVVVRRQ